MAVFNIWFSGAFVIFLFLGGCIPNKLHLEAYRGNLLSVKEILDNGEKIGKTDNRGWTALHYAAGGDQEAIVDLLLDKGAEINAQGNRGETPLHVATYFCHERVVASLLNKRASFSITYDSGKVWVTPLMIAGSNGCSPNLVKHLLRAGADPNEIEGKNGYSSLMFAVASGNVQTVQMLVSAGADVDHQAKDGLTALIDASAKGNSEIVRILLNHGANSSTKINSDPWGELEKGGLVEVGDTALSVAKRRGHSEVVALLEAAEGVKNLH
jgi:cytohesin